jgi:hypothetical protein
MMSLLLLLVLCKSFHLDHDKFIKIPLEKRELVQTSSKKSLSPLRHTTYPSFISSKSTILLEDYNNQQFVGQVGIGTPPQYLSVIFDTGSGNFFLNSNLCMAKSCLSRESYDHEQSSTYSSLELDLQVSFGSGVMEGNLCNDTLTMGGVEIPSQNFAEVIYEVGSVFYGAKFSGIMGLGFRSLAHESTVPVFDNIIQSKILEWNVFGFYYCLDEKKHSELMIGDIDNRKFTGKIHWVPVTPDPYYWTVIIDEVRFGHKSTGLCKEGCMVAIDTGTTLMLAPSKAIDILYDHLPSGCNFKNMPDLVFIIKGKSYSIPATSYMISVENGVEEDPGVHNEKVPDDCVFAFGSLDIDPPFGPVWVFGNIFMNSYYVAFDRDNLSVGFGRSVNWHDSN